MECVGLVVVLLVMTVVIPMAQMLFGKGPNNWRRLLRLDLAALLVIVAGFAGALAIVRWFDLSSALCLLTIVLPLSLCFAWLCRYLLEDFSRKRLHRASAKPDLSFLSEEAKLPEPVVNAELIDDEQNRNARP